MSADTTAWSMTPIRLGTGITNPLSQEPEPMSGNQTARALQAWAALKFDTSVYWSFAKSKGKDGRWAAALRIDIEGQPTTFGFGLGPCKKSAKRTAYESVWAKLPKPPDWEELYRRAQQGDILIRLAAMSMDSSPRARQEWLADRGSDRHLRTVFDRLLSQGEPGAMVVKGSTDKDRATYVEALVWERFSRRVLRPGAAQALSELRELLE